MLIDSILLRVLCRKRAEASREDIEAWGAYRWWLMCGRQWELIVRLDKRCRELQKRLDDRDKLA